MARREAERAEQEARGKLERQKIHDDADAEKTKKQLLELQAESAAVESTGQAKAEAQSRAEAARIEAEGELERLTAAWHAELTYLQEQNRLEINRAEEMSRIESEKFKNMVDSLGTDAIRAIASGPQDHQVKMLQSLGLNSTLITDGRTPINLFNTASGLLGTTLPNAKE